MKELLYDFMDSEYEIFVPAHRFLKNMFYESNIPTELGKSTVNVNVSGVVFYGIGKHAHY